MKRSVSLLLSVIFAGVLMTSCKDDRYVASVTELQLASVSPATGYSGGIIKILGRNFSDVFGENRVFIGDLEAQVLEYNPWDLTVVLPAQEPGTYVITVQTPKGTISGLTFDYKEKPEHEYITSIVAGGAIGFADGNGASAKIHQPEGIAMDPSGNLWITQRGTSGYAIRKMDRSFNVTTVLETELPWQCCFDNKGDFYFTAKDKNFTFQWGKTEIREAELVNCSTNNFIRFHWKDDDSRKSYFELKIVYNELTEDLTLEVTDWALPGEEDDVRDLWDSDIDKLKRVSGL